MIETLAVIVVVVGTLVLLFAWSAAISIWNAWWASKVWAILVVPSLHLPPLPMAAAVGFAFVFAILRHNNPGEGTSEEESRFMRVWKVLAPSLIGAPMIYVVAKIVAHFVF